jgi:PAS domain S-box-containing protein
MRKEEERALGPRAIQALPANERRVEGMKRSELATLAHELSVHQVELEIQNQELRQARTATEEARARYLDLFDSAPVGYFLLDEHSRIVEANLTGCRLLQVDRRSTRNEPFSKFLPSDDADRFYLHRRKLLEEEVKQTFETRVLRGDGTLFWAQLDCTKTGREGLRLAMTDISERKKDEEALRENERRLQIIASNSPDHILLQDSELRYQFVTNPKLGLTREDMIGKTDREILAEEDAERLSVIKRRVIDTGEPYHLQTSLVNKEGQKEYFDGSYIPVFDTAGEPSGLAGYFRNVTAAKKAETELKLERENYRNSLEMSPLGVQVVAPGGEALFVNPALLNMMGYGSLEEWNSVPLEQRLGPESAAWVRI